MSRRNSAAALKNTNNAVPFPTGLEDNILEFALPQLLPQENKTKETAVYKSDGVKKATPADPIHDAKDIVRIQKYFLDRKEYRNYAIFTLGISSMLRASDLLAITFGDILESETGSIRRGSVREHVLVKEKKTGKRNNVYINEKCREAVQFYVKSISRKTPIAEDTPLFFSDMSMKKDPEHVKAISIQMLDKILKRVQRDLGIKDHLSSHSMRKTMVYHTIKNSSYDQYTLYLLQRMLNHSDVRTTFRYCGMEEEGIRKIREDIGKTMLY